MHNNKNLNLKSGDEGIAWEAGFDPYPSTPPPLPPTEYCRKILSAI